MDINSFSNEMRTDRKVNICCEACGANKTIEFNRIGRISRPGIYGIVPIGICTICGYKYQTPRFSETFYEQYYKSLYRKVTFGTDNLSDKYIERQRLRGSRVLEYLKSKIKLSTGTLLDHGCAYGATMLPYVENNWTCFGIDPHVPSVKLGSSRLGLNIKEAKGESLPFENNFFDIIISLGSLEHVYSLENAIKECFRVLKEGGLLFIRWRSNKLWGSSLEYYNHNHFRFFTFQTLKICFERYGLFEVIKSFEEIEGITGAAYFIVKKDTKKKIDQNWNINNYEIDNYLNEIKILNEYNQNYKTRCIKIIDIAKRFQNNNEKIYDYILHNEPNIKFLMGRPEITVPRAILEAKKFLEVF